MNLIDLKMSGLTNKLADELHQRVIKSFPKRHVYVHSIDQTWAVDLVDMQQYSKQNKNYKYHGLKILMINEIIPNKTIRIMIEPDQLDNATATRPTLEEVETIQEVTS